MALSAPRQVLALVAEARMKVYLAALGCKLNRAEIESLGRRVAAAGHQVVTDPAAADWAILNTCTVTHIAARKSRQGIRHLHRVNPNLRLAVTGCYAEMSPEQTRKLEGVELVIPNADKERALELVLAAGQSEPPVVLRPSASQGQPLPGGRTRAFVKIGDGCDNACAYCIVTIARGPSRSRPLAAIVREVEARLAEGYREVVLTGVNIGAYGRDLAPDARCSLAELVRELLRRTEVPRLRLSSIEPWDLSDELMALWPDERLCRHLHLPLQSGCEATLQRMGRRLTAGAFAEKVRLVRQRAPGISITTDVIVGFPGETEAEFEESLAFVRAMRFSRLHVFRYSPRPGTVAEGMAGQVPAPVAQERSEQLIALGKELSLAYHAQFVGREVGVLFEAAPREKGAQMWAGLTDNYLRVRAPSEDDLANRLVAVCCLSASASGLLGELA